jgi:hypothetical protein
MANFLQCNNCNAHGCRIKPVGKCDVYEKPVFMQKNTMFDNLVHKSEEQAVQVLNLLDAHQISFKRYTN